MAAGASQGVHWIINNMDSFVDRKLQAALPAALLNIQLPAPTDVSALTPTPAPHNGDADRTAQLTLAQDMTLGITIDPSTHAHT